MSFKFLLLVTVSIGDNTCPLGKNPSTDAFEILSLEKQVSTDAIDDRDERKLFDLSQDCSEFGPHCQCKREAGTYAASKYYSMVAKEKSKPRKWPGASNGTLFYGISAEDPRPNGVDKYIDYLHERTTPYKPSHGIYGRLPTNVERDPTCTELKNKLHEMCGNGNKPYGNWGTDDGTLGKVCGMGTYWNPTFKKCVRHPDESIGIDNRGKPFCERVYPFIRPRGYKSVFDAPDDQYAYLDDIQQNLLDNDKKCVPSYDGGECTADRCRFPLTSAEGRKQAKLYVKLFRTIYEYKGLGLEGNANDQDKARLKGKIRHHIAKHKPAFDTIGPHRSGDFLPWHRWYLLEMESILLQGQKVYNLGETCQETFFGIPYFDWHNLKGNETPMEFINDKNDEFGHHFDGSLGQATRPDPNGGYITEGALKDLETICAPGGNSTFKEKRLARVWINDASESEIDSQLHDIYATPASYNNFRCALEDKSGPNGRFHGLIHDIIGGHMCTGWSSNDPIFFTHHANIDKIWRDWQTQSDKHRDYFEGFTERNALMLGCGASPLDMLDIKNLTYRQDDKDPITIKVEYVDMDTSTEWGRGNTCTITPTLPNTCIAVGE